MINLFRKIRKQLAFENNARKYLRYAFGEVFLVVIGILIALQLNTWNENRKHNIEELEYLKRLESDLTVSIEKTQNYMDFMNESAKQSTIIIRCLNNCNIPESDKLAFANGLYHLGKISHPVLVDGTILELQSTGKLLIIRNVSLRDQMTIMLGVYKAFRILMPQAEARVMPPANYVEQNVTFNIEKPTMGTIELNLEDVNFDIDSLCKDKRFIAAVYTIRNYTFELVKWDKITMTEFKKFRKSVRAEIEKLERM